MTNNILTLGMLVASGWLFADVLRPEPASRTFVPRVVTIESPVPTYATAIGSVTLEARRAPVPLVRNVRAFPTTTNAPDMLVPDAEAQAQDELDKKAAKAAIEADGYKRASVLGKGIDGSWRAKAYRGSTEVQLTVDGTGRVTLE